MDAEELITLGLNLSHDIRTPLASIKAGASGIRDFLPFLIDAYHKANNANLLTDRIQPYQIELLTKTLGNIEISANIANEQISTFIENLNNKGRQKK